MNNNQSQIKFYSWKAKNYGFMSNFYEAPITLDGKLWPTTEHYFQAMKFPDEYYQEKVRLAETALLAFRLGRSRSSPIRPDWE